MKTTDRQYGGFAVRCVAGVAQIVDVIQGTLSWDEARLSAIGYLAGLSSEQYLVERAEEAVFTTQKAIQEYVASARSRVIPNWSTKYTRNTISQVLTEIDSAPSATSSVPESFCRDSRRLITTGGFRLPPESAT